MYPVKTPFFWKWLFPHQLWHMPRNRRVIYLTFDDGPIPLVTPWVLKTLEEHQAKATFFCIGDNVRKHPGIYADVVAAGHQTGNHTFNHLKGISTPDETYFSNIATCAEYVHSPLFRPPYGRIRKRQVQHLKKQGEKGYDIVMWDVLSGDFDLDLSPEKCLKNVLRHTANGSIVVFHDSQKAFPRLEYVLPRALKIWGEKGFRFEALPAH
ncbi:MAG: polysaccharide deacetylase family protein [Mucilaginibacter polytrichastri]|nr:polysaccharide deacetylase family protein [Mucilaginibacter polytrichastri]